MRTDILERKQEILQWIKEERPKNFICQQLKCKPTTLNNYLKKMGIEYKGQQNKKGQQKGPNTYIPASYYFDNQTMIKSSLLREKLIRDGYKENKCEICGCQEWLGHKVPLELHHKNNNHFDNSLENLQILCPNCHSIQNGNSGANIGKYQNSSSKKVELKNFCVDCGKPISKNATRCQECYHKTTQRINGLEQYTFKNKLSHTEITITRNELKIMLRNDSFVQIGKKYGVSDNAVRKWCDAFNLPRRAKEIKQFTDEEWTKI